MRSRKSYVFVLTSEPRGREEEECWCWSWLAYPQFHWGIYRSGQGSNGGTVGPNQIGSDIGPDCSHSIWGEKVGGRLQEREGGLGVSKDSQGHEWANGLMLEALSKGMAGDCDLCDEAG